MVRDAGRTLLLTPKERALLRVLTVHPGRLYTREHLLDALYGFDAEADSNTLEVFISRLRSRSEEHTSELQSQSNLVCRLLLEKKKKKQEPKVIKQSVTVH